MRRRETTAEREERRALARQKPDPPGSCEGKAGLAVFDKWTYEVDTWVRMSKYREPTVLKQLSKRASYIPLMVQDRSLPTTKFITCRQHTSPVRV